LISFVLSSCRCFLFIIWNPLHYAAEAGNIEIVKILIKHRVDINALTLSNTTARFYSSIKRYKDIEKILLENGALDCDNEFEMIKTKLQIF